MYKMAGERQDIKQLQEFIIEQNKIQTESLTAQIKQVANYTEEIKKLLINESEKVEVLQNQVQKLNARNEVLEKLARKNNIIVYNSNYQEGDLLDFFKNLTETYLQIKLSDSEIDNLYLLSRDKQLNSKPILVRFVSYLTKNKILQNCKYLKNSDTQIVVTEDLTEQERIEKRLLVHYMKKAKEENKKAHIYKNKLFIEGKSFTYKQLEESKLEERTEDGKIANTEIAERKVNQKKNIQNTSKKTAGDYQLRNRNNTSSPLAKN